MRRRPVSNEKRSKLLAAVCAATLFVATVLFFSTPVLHDEFQVARCGAGSTEFLVEVIGTYAQGALERRSPYDVRLVQPAREAGPAIAGWRNLTFSGPGSRLALHGGGDSKISDTKEGPSSRVLIFRGVPLPYTDLEFGADVHLEDGHVIRTRCQLIARPVREWRVPWLDALMSV